MKVEQLKWLACRTPEARRSSKPMVLDLLVGESEIEVLPREKGTRLDQLELVPVVKWEPGDVPALPGRLGQTPSPWKCLPGRSMHVPMRISRSKIKHPQSSIVNDPHQTWTRP